MTPTARSFTAVVAQFNSAALQLIRAFLTGRATRTTVVSAYVFEYLWHFIFIGSPVDCRRGV
jgi:hypothetical protein